MTIRTHPVVLLILEPGDSLPVENWVTPGSFARTPDGAIHHFVEGAWAPLFTLLAPGEPATGQVAEFDGTDPIWSAN